MTKTYYRKYLDPTSREKVPASTASRRTARREINKKKYELVYEVKNCIINIDIYMYLGNSITFSVGFAPPCLQKGSNYRGLFGVMKNFLIFKLRDRMPKYGH